MTSEPDWLTTDRPEPWAHGPARRIFEKPWMEVIEQEATAPTGRRANYGWVRFRNVGVGVLPIHADGTVVLVGQQRFTLANFSWEMPQGGGPEVSRSRRPVRLMNQILLALAVDAWKASQAA